MLRIGERFDRYVIEEILGAGGMGRVYKAFDDRLHRSVALKALLVDDAPSEGATRRESVKRLLREARAAAALRHPNVVAIFDVGEHEGVPFLAMEFLSGTSLRPCVGDAAIPARERIRWLCDVADVLAAAHRAGLVHRDVKPENVMLTDDDLVKVLDFGIARRGGDVPYAAGASSSPEDPLATGNETFAGAGQLVGTPLYMAPELFRFEAADARSDQFAWGVLAYELLSGALPFGRGSPVALQARMDRDAAEPLPRGDAPIADEVAAVVERALHRDPAARFPSMEQIVTALAPHAAVATRGGAPSGQMPIVRRIAARRAAILNATTRASISGNASVAVSPSVVLSSPSDPSTGTLSSPDVAPAPSGAFSHGAAVLAPRPTPTTTTAGAPALPPSAPRRRAVIGFALASTLALVLASLSARRSPSAEAVAAFPSVSSSPPAVSAVILDALPDPRGSVPGAIAAYRAGLTALRAGAFAGGVRELERALELDPDLAAARVQILAFVATFDLTSDATRRHFVAAWERRDRLSERDRVMLDGLDPITRAHPSDWRESARRFALATDRFPGDAQMWLLRATAVSFSEGMAVAAPHLERAIELDPSYFAAVTALAELDSYLGRGAAARARLARCMSASPAALGCMELDARLLESAGACADAEERARALIAADPRATEGHVHLARALARRGQLDAALESLAKAWETMPASDREATELEDRAHVAALGGDFDAAMRAASKLGEIVKGSDQASEHGRAARLLAALQLEAGRAHDAGATATTFLRKKDAWQPPADNENLGLASDATIELLAIARRAGALDDAAFRAARGAWEVAWRAKVAPDYQDFVWLFGHALPVDIAPDAELADSAFRALGEDGGIPPHRARVFAESGIGAMYLLSGHGALSRPILERGAASCNALDYPIPWVRASFWLGRALEATGDEAGACAAYAEVVARWGNARPTSTTAAGAAARRKKLGCKSVPSPR